MSAVEAEVARSVRDVVHGSRVTAVEPGRLVLDAGSHAVPPGTLAVDCTAAGLGRNLGVVQPVFSPGRIALQTVRQYQPTFSAALIGQLEAAVDPAERAALTRVAPMTDSVSDWVAGQLATTANQAAWASHPVVRDWLAGCRLDLASTWAAAGVDRAARRAAIGAFQELVGPAVANLARLLSPSPTLSEAVR
ncbi:hypothetical protein RB608_19920 [Nocardioides sp. LHD-245]|uniref:hypothetical protein n=1 Tax=Nocardioides sp. LHD-245 TaxID=3051387 RepID=UPI0027E166E9|nr:hypothetical protein [Nocardioides sp. LHD-245]